MTFADPRICLSCGGSIDEGVAICPHCGMNLGSAEIQQAWRALVIADQWVAKAREAVPEVAANASTPPRPRRHLSAGTVLLVLGAVALLVAGLIFITV
jgi:RNA polymerase subunit RPABC4/transcription elongation factor Spt4